MATKAQILANKKWKAKNKAKQEGYRLKSNAKKFIELASLEDLMEVEEMVSKRKAELSAKDNVSKGEDLSQVTGVTISDDGTISVKKPYNAAFVEFAHGQQAKWNPSNKSWNFAAESADRLVQSLQHIYGEVVGQDNLITVRYRASDFDMFKYGIKIGSIVTAIRRGRDSRVQIMSNTMIVSGQFADRAGSNKYPSVTDSDTSDEDNPTLESKIPQDVYDGLTEDKKKKLNVVSN